MKNLYILVLVVFSILLAGCSQLEPIEPGMLDVYFDETINYLDLRGQEWNIVPDFCNGLSSDIHEEVGFVDLSNNALSVVDGRDFSCLSSLTGLDVSYNDITNVRSLDDLDTLQEMYIHYNQLSSLQGFGALSNLVILHAGYNNISDISGLAGLGNLLDLQLQHNDIDDISVLSGLPQLQSLKLEFNQLDNDQSAYFQGLVRLRFLSVGKNPMDEDIINAWQNTINQ